MADYFGLEAICKRMGWKDPKTPVEQFKRTGFLMFQRRKGSHPRRVWYTNDQLIAAWEIARCKADRERILDKKQRRAKTAGQSGGL